jgi:hypothetical protein
MMPFQVVIKKKSRHSKGAGWDERSAMRFSTLLKANTYQYNQRLKLQNYDGHFEITDNYSSFSGKPIGPDTYC